MTTISIEQDQVYGFISIIHDISERVRQETETRRYQEELSHSRRLSLLGEMAAGLAHEINQPLVAIINYTQGCIQLLQRKGFEPNELLEVLNIISEQGDRASKIIARIRSFIKKEKMKKERVNLYDMIKESGRIYRIRFASSQYIRNA